MYIEVGLVSKSLKGATIVTTLGKCGKMYKQQDHISSFPPVSVSSTDEEKPPNNSEGQCGNSKN